MKIIVATTNKHKLKEIRHILQSTVASSTSLGASSRPSPVRENGKTFEENAIKKVKAIRLKEGEIAVADDSGLMVNCLGGKPGVRSARFANPPTPINLCTKLLKVIQRTEDRRRGAKFVCAIAVAYPNGKVRVVKGVCRGRIIHEMRGKYGFGYDPVFIPCGYGKTFAEMLPALKNRISHRARALKKLKAIV